jgi:hypothetical protein
MSNYWFHFSCQALFRAVVVKTVSVTPVAPTGRHLGYMRMYNLSGCGALHLKRHRSQHATACKVLVNPVSRHGRVQGAGVHNAPTGGSHGQQHTTPTSLHKPVTPCRCCYRCNNCGRCTVHYDQLHRENIHTRSRTTTTDNQSTGQVQRVPSFCYSLFSTHSSPTSGSSTKKTGSKLQSQALAAPYGPPSTLERMRVMLSSRERQQQHTNPPGIPGVWHTARPWGQADTNSLH